MNTQRDIRNQALRDALELAAGRLNVVSVRARADGSPSHSTYAEWAAEARASARALAMQEPASEPADHPLQYECAHANGKGECVFHTRTWAEGLTAERCKNCPASEPALCCDPARYDRGECSPDCAIERAPASATPHVSTLEGLINWLENDCPISCNPHRMNDALMLRARASCRCGELREALTEIAERISNGSSKLMSERRVLDWVHGKALAALTPSPKGEAK